MGIFFYKSFCFFFYRMTWIWCLWGNKNEIANIIWMLQFGFSWHFNWFESNYCAAILIWFVYFVVIVAVVVVVMTPKSNAIVKLDPINIQTQKWLNCKQLMDGIEIEIQFIFVYVGIWQKKKNKHQFVNCTCDIGLNRFRSNHKAIFMVFRKPFFSD